MSWECPRCLHHTADGQKHHCINDELTTAQAEIGALTDTLEESHALNKKLEAENIELTAERDEWFRQMNVAIDKAEEARDQADALCAAIEEFLADGNIHEMILTEAAAAYRASKTGGE